MAKRTIGMRPGETKAEYILRLDDGTRSSREIAEIAGCTVSYVRTARQRIAGRSEYDLAYSARKKEQKATA